MKYFLYGPPASGKSTLGRGLAAAWGIPFVDLDARIAARTGQSIPQIFATAGEAAFRRLEAEALAAAGREEGDAVVALGGGALLNPANRSLAEAAGAVLVLEASAETLLARAEAARGQRPLLAGDSPAAREERLRRLLQARAAHYRSFARRLPTDGRSPEDALWEAQIRFGRFRLRGMVSPRAAEGYTVLAQAGVRHDAGERLRAAGLAGPVALVSDTTVAALHADAVQASLEAAGYRVARLTFPPGEAHKTMATVQRLWEGFLQAGLERGSTVVALGGGVVGDLAGFAAATYMRGIAWVNLPTSLLAMVDAGLGGKTGADLPAGKNLVGAFHPPRLVLADPQVLATLPEEEFRNGMAEVVKHGVIGDPALFDRARSGARAALTAAVAQAMAVKIRIIEADPYERGPRAALNLGHTIGHGVEAASGFSLRHGEAVAIGMVAEARLAARLGLAAPALADEIAAALQAWRLPTAIPAGLSAEAIWQAMRHDKKKAGGRLRFALPVRLGEVRVGVPVPEDDIRQVLRHPTNHPSNQSTR